MRLMLAVVLSSFAVAVATAAPGPFHRTETPATASSPVAAAPLQAATPVVVAPPPATPGSIEALYRQVLALNPLPEPMQWDHLWWLEEGAPPDDTRYRERLDASVVLNRKARALRPRITDLERGCLDIVLKACRSRGGGFPSFGPDLQEGRVYWQLQDGFTDAEGVGGGVVLLQPDANGRLKPFAWTFEGYRYEPPQIYLHDGRWILVSQGISRGTGSGDMTIMLVWREGGWRAVNMDWKASARRFLGDLESHQQPDWNFEDLSLRTDLWTPTDGGCCGTGGTAELQLDIVDDRLVVTSADIRNVGE
ncbi:hypothetical protein BH10PSE1_BH10PSE1_30870 [soil metagenome]